MPIAAKSNSLNLAMILPFPLVSQEWKHNQDFQQQHNHGTGRLGKAKNGKWANLGQNGLFLRK